MIGALFGAEVRCASSRVFHDVDRLLPGERPFVARAVEKRRREFATGRVLARALLAELGFEEFPLLPDSDRAPVWPAGIIGSISHCAGFCGVALARRSALAGLGLDVEPDQSLEPELWRRICTQGELRMLERQSAEQRGRLARALFSAKESIYKCLFPLARQPLGFHDVELELDPEAERFHARALRPDALLSARLELLRGSWLRRDGWIATGAVLPAPAEDRA